MKKLLTLIICYLSILSSTVQAQTKELYFLSGTVVPDKNIQSAMLMDLDLFNQTNGTSSAFVYLQFEDLPDEHTIMKLSGEGVVLLEYLPTNSYLAELKDFAALNSLKSYGIVSILDNKSVYKLHPTLVNKNYPSHAMKESGTIDLVLTFVDHISENDISAAISDAGGKIIEIGVFLGEVKVRVETAQIEQLASIPVVTALHPIDPEPVEYNSTARTLHRANVLSTDYSAGRKYDGSGVVIIEGDGGNAGVHLDLKGRYLDFASGFSDHATHVGGTVIGAGNIDPLARGHATGANIVAYRFGGSISNAERDYDNRNARITTNSWGPSSPTCAVGGYVSMARNQDLQMIRRTSLLHIFAAANDGRNQGCYGAGGNWGTVSSYGHSKNNLTVGALDMFDQLASFSGVGPSYDGRIKPDICGKGSGVYSTLPGNGYGNKSGTSMSTPGVSGTIAQLYDAYRQLNGNQDPKSALIKAAALNTTEDLGNTGPDYRFGWGRINGLKAVRVLEEERYLTATVSNGATRTHQINVPANVREVRFMVYWNDPAASLNVSRALVNDLDITATGPGGTFRPWQLRTEASASALNAPAFKGEDHRNNVEQVAINSPSAGTYSINVRGFSVPRGPQEYFLVYEFIKDEIEVTYPIGGEGFRPGTRERIRWDAHGTSGNFSIQYSTNNGTSWTTISSNVAGTRRHYSWDVPNTITGQALVRVRRGGQSDQSEETFTIISRPTNVEVDWVCPNAFKLDWSGVTGATEYEVFMLGDRYMESVGTSPISEIVINSAANQEEWVGVRALGPNGIRSERTYAIRKRSGQFGCPGGPDIQLASIDNPSGSVFCEGLSDNLTFTVRNNGTESISGFTATYSVNGVDQDSKIVTGSLAPGQSTQASFDAPMSLDDPGSFEVRVRVAPTGANDFNMSNNEALRVVDLQILGTPDVINAEICDAGEITLRANNTVDASDFFWFSDEQGTNQVEIGDEYTTTISQTTTFYVQESTIPATLFAGPADNSIGTGGAHAGGFYLSFEAQKPFILSSAIVYADGAGTRTFELRDNNGQLIQSVQKNLANGENTVEFDLEIVSGRYWIGAASGANLYRNNSGVIYPYELDGVLSINSAVGSDGVPLDGFYYYLYNWEIVQTEGCEGELTEVEATVINLEAPFGDDVQFCTAGNVTLTANSTAGEISWFDEEQGGSAIATGNDYVANLSETTTFYVEANTTSAVTQAGKADNSGGGASHAGGFYLVFDVTKEFNLNKATVYATGTKERTLELRNASGNLIDSKVINIPDGTSEIDINWVIGPDQGYQIGFATGADLFRSNGGVNYPYVVPGVLSINESTAGSDPSGFYYYLYDWEIQETGGCTSDRIAIQAIKDVCVGMGENSELVLDLFPNPNSGSFKLVVDHRAREIEIINEQGLLIHKEVLTSPEVSFEGFASGMYLVRITSEDQTYRMRKLIVQ